MPRAMIRGFPILYHTARESLCSSQACMIVPKSIHGISLANLFFMRTMHIFFSIQ
jgi:hypothetical protein